LKELGNKEKVVFLRIGSLFLKNKENDKIFDDLVLLMLQCTCILKLPGA
jgi:hypothetical protein